MSQELDGYWTTGPTQLLVMLPCPFCALSNMELRWHVPHGSWTINCIACRASGPEKACADEAVEAWNAALRREQGEA